MGIKRYVQHISGQGEKWELFNEAQHCHESEWRVKARTHEWYHDLPKSEYILCAPPEEWEDVTDNCDTDSYFNSAGEFFSILHLGGLCFNSADGEPRSGDANVMFRKYGYRIRKLERCNGPCFIIERKKQ